MADRARNKNLHLRFTEEELFFFMKRFADSGVRYYSDFVLQAIAGQAFYNVDITPMFAVAEQIGKLGTNLNQIAKAANTSGNIYLEDIKEMQRIVKKVDDLVAKRIGLMVKAKKGELPDYGIYQNKAN